MSSPSHPLQTYTVQPSESINDIAVKFHIPTHRILENNPHLPRTIPPGTTLQIESPDVALTEHYQFFVLLFEAKFGIPSGPGSVTIDGNFLHFTTPESSHLEINLQCLISADVYVHPTAMRNFHQNFDAPGVPALLVIIFRSDIQNPDAEDVVCFSAVRSELSALQFVIAKVSNSWQRAPAVTPELSTVKRLSSVDSANFRVCGKRSGILTDEHIGHLRAAMALQYRKMTWKLLYDMNENGVAFVTFYEKAAEKVPQLLVLETDRAAVLGCFVPQGFHKEQKAYGSGEVFVWSMRPSVAVYRWAQTNQTFVAASLYDIVIGGPAPALFIAAHFERGFTESCVTFASPRLIDQKSFGIVRAELWGLSNRYA
jgi:hypothetical protein